MEKDKAEFQKSAQSNASAGGFESQAHQSSLHAPTFQLKSSDQNGKEESDSLTSDHSRSISSGAGDAPPSQLKNLASNSNSNNFNSIPSLAAPTFQLQSNTVQLKEGEGSKSAATEKLGQGTDGLPPNLQSGIESMSGMNMDDVQVHRNSSKPAALNAHAYAQGSDIHLGAGQEKHLAHEAWHVVQQKQGRVKPTTQLKGKTNINDDVGLEKEADVMGAKALQMKAIGNSNPSAYAGATNNSQLIQRVEKTGLATGLTHLGKMEGKSLRKGERGDEVIAGQKIVVDTSKFKKSRRGHGQDLSEDIDASEEHSNIWYLVLSIDGKAISGKQYIRAGSINLSKESGGSKAGDVIDGVSSVFDAVTNVPGSMIGNEGVTGVADALNQKTVFTDTGGNSDAPSSDLQHAKNMGIAGDFMGAGAGVIGLVQGFKNLGDPDASATDLINTALDIEKGAMKTGESVAKLTHTFSGSDTPTDASKFGSTFEGYGAAFSAIQDAFNGMRALLKLFNAKNDYTTRERAAEAAKAAVHVLSAGKNIVLSVKSFIELVSGAASGALMAAVPGLDIAIAGAHIITDIYYIFVSNSSRKVMNERRLAISNEKGKSKEDMVENSEQYRKSDADVANRKKLLKRYEKEFASSKTKSSRKDELKTKITQLKLDIATGESFEIEGFERDVIEEFTMATELRDANTKRVTRQGILIGIEATKIAGSIATLTGVGALAGGITKGAAAAGELSLPAARFAKQTGRNRKADKNAHRKREDLDLNKSKKMSFDGSKSDAAKSDFRTTQVKNLIKLMVHCPDEGEDGHNAKVGNIESYLEAAGISQRKLFKYNGNPQKQVSLLLEAIQEREFI